MKMSEWCLMAAACALGVQAGTYTWTGAQDAFWTNKNNWAEGTVPGQWLAPQGAGIVTNGVAGDTAIFGACETGNTTIDLSGQWGITAVIVTNGAPAYTFGTSNTTEAQYLKLLPTFDFTVADGVENDQTIACLAFLFDPAKSVGYSAYYMRLRNHSTQARLVYKRLDKVSHTVAGKNLNNACPYYYYYGKGTIEQDGPIAFDRSSGAYFYTTGLFRLGDSSNASGSRVYTYTSEASAELGDEFRQIEIPAGRYMNTTGGGWSDKIITANQNTRIYGEGSVLARNHFNSSKIPAELGGNFSAAAGKTLRVECAIVPAAGGVNFFPGSIGAWGSGTIHLTGTNSCTGDVRIHDVGTLAVDKIGMKGCSAAETCLGPNANVRFSSNGTLRYVGEAAMTTDRAFHTTNATAALTITFANGGGGTCTLNSHCKMLLPNALGVTLKLNAETAPIIFDGSFEEGQNWHLALAGGQPISFPAAPGVDVTLLAGANLFLSSTNGVPGTLAVAGNASVTVPADDALTLSSMPTVASGATLDFVMGENATVTFAEHPNMRLSGVTLNGVAAETDANGRLQAARAYGVATWTSCASGGSWSAEANWKDEQKPGVNDSVVVANEDSASGTYTITLDEDAVLNGITEQEQAGGTVTLAGTKTLTLSGDGYTLVTNTTVAIGANNVAGGPFNFALPVHLQQSQRWLLGGVRGWNYTSGCNTFTGDLSSDEGVEWALLGYARYRFSSGSSENFKGTTKVGCFVEFAGTNQFHRLGTNEIHLYRAVLDDSEATAAGTLRTSPGLTYKFNANEYAATVVNPIKVTATAYVGTNGGRNGWSYDGTPIAFQWANSTTAFTNRDTRLTLTGGISSGSFTTGYLQFSAAWADHQPMITYRTFDPDFGRIVLAGDGGGWLGGTARTYTTIEIAHANACGPNNARSIAIGSDGYWGAYYPYTVAGVLVRPGLTYSGAISTIYRSDANGSQNRPATAIVGTASTPATADATTATFSGEVKDDNEHSNELRFTAAKGTTAKFTGKVTVHANRWKYHGTPDIVGLGDVELANTANTFGTNLCVRGGRLVLDANAAGRLPIVLGGYVKTLAETAEVRCMDGTGAVLGTVANDGAYYGKKMTFTSVPTVDGVKPQVGDFVLVAYPGWVARNGVWKVVSATEWRRPDDLDDVDDVIASRGLRVKVKEGSTFGGTAHFLVTDPLHFRLSSQFERDVANERMGSSYGVPIFHPESEAEPEVAVLTGGAVTITNAIVVTDNKSTGASIIGSRETGTTSGFSGPVMLAKTVTLAAADGATVNFTGAFTGAGDILAGGAGVSDVTGATISTDATNGFGAVSGTLKVTAAQLGTRPLRWVRRVGETAADDASGVVAVQGDLDLRNRTVVFENFKIDSKSADSAEPRTFALATATGAITLPTRSGLPAGWCYRVENGTLYAHYAYPGLTIIIR